MKHAVKRIHFVEGFGMPTKRTVAARRVSA